MSIGLVTQLDIVSVDHLSSDCTIWIFSYPADDLEHTTRVGPKPSTFSGQRGIEFCFGKSKS